MSEDTIQIIRIETGEAVKSVNDLKENVKILKENLGTLEIGTTEYQDTLTKLKENQAALKDAMYATSSSMEEVAANAKGINVVFDENNKLINQQNQSYNALVNTMAELKTRWRATADEAERNELGERIKQINDELKDMDASVGNFSRNVGDYTNSIKKALGDFPSFADPAKKAIKTVNDTASLLAGNPVMGVLALITPLVTKITESLQEDEDSLGAINKVMDSMKPVMDFFQAVLGQLIDYLTKAIEKVAEFLGNSGLFSKIVDGLVGVGNAILQYVIAPFKGVAAAIRVFQEEGIKGLRNATKAFADELKSGVAFKSNYQAGVAAVDGMLAGVKDKKKDATEAGKGVVKSLKDGIDKELDKMVQDLDKKLEADIAKLVKSGEDEAKAAENIIKGRLANIDKAAKYQMELNELTVKDEKEKAALSYQIQANANRMKLEAIKEFADEAMAAGDVTAALEYQQEAADLEVEIALNAAKEIKRIEDETKKTREENAKAQIATMMSVADATAGILDSIASMYESDQEGQAKNATKIKALRIATATIDTISGAIGAYMQAVKAYPAPAGQIVGGVQAAAVTAAGVANIAKIRATDMTGNSSVAVPSSGVPAVTAAPTITTEVPRVRNLTSASEEERLNKMTDDQRVVLVMSDLEVRQNQARVQVAEASF